LLFFHGMRMLTQRVIPKEFASFMLLTTGKKYDRQVLPMQGQENTMKEVHSTVTTKGQVTIPIEIRRLLQVQPHDRIAFVVEDEQVRLVRSQSVVARTAGALKLNKPPLSAEELREVAEEAMAKEATLRMGT
jgi:antitoxin PrlF